MPLINVVGGYDGVTFPPGITNQSTTSTMDIGGALESGGAGNPLGMVNPLVNNYLAWSVYPEDATSSALAMTTTSGWLTRIFASASGPCAHLDLVFISGTITNSVFALYSGASFATGPLVWTADTHAAMVAGLVPLTWNGASSPASVSLVAGQTYWLYTEWTGTSPVIAGVQIGGAATAPAAALANANLTATSSFANNAMTLAAGAPTTLAANTTLTPQTSWANTSTKPWYGLRA